MFELSIHVVLGFAQTQNPRTEKGCFTFHVLTIPFHMLDNPASKKILFLELSHLTSANWFSMLRRKS